MLEAIPNALHEEFDTHHAKFKAVSIHHLTELFEEIIGWKQRGFITEQFFRQNYSEFSFTPPENLPDAHSILIIGTEQKMFPVEFFYVGKRYRTVLGSNYKYSDIRGVCTEILSRILGKDGYCVERAVLPLKLLAVRSGLAKYGKNNISYIDGMGSFIRLEAYYTDYEFPDDWQEKQLMKPCATCSLCHDACPTRCIPGDRVLIHADHCLAHFNENPGEFPEWIPSQAHNALVGCMRCQLVCPQNRKYQQMNTRSLVFSEEETTILLENRSRERMPRTLKEKLLAFDIDEYYSILGRNLSALINQKSSP